MEKLGQRLKTFRKAIKKSQAEIAEVLGVEQALISMVENQKTELAYWHMKKLKETFNLSLEWLETGQGEMFTSVPEDLELVHPEELYTPKLTQRRVDKVMAAVDQVMRERGMKTYEDFCLKNGLYFNYLYEFKAGRIKDANKLIYDILYKKYKINLGYLFYEDPGMFIRDMDDVKILTIAIDRNNNEIVKAVPAYAQAGYQRGFADPEFLETLPDYDFYTENDGTYRVFELKGDSMVPHLYEGDFVKAKYLPHIHWRDKLRLKEIFIVVSKDGIVCKQLLDHDVETGDILLHSFNDLYDDYSINLGDVYELWYYKGYYSRRPLRTIG
ncbi:MAG: LexA family transcriptional regulator [Chitinophagales bacterium]|nr:LexA family transcriptional regulator [Chitinophagales bacterium]